MGAGLREPIETRKLKRLKCDAVEKIGLVVQARKGLGVLGGANLQEVAEVHRIQKVLEGKLAPVVPEGAVVAVPI